MFKYVSLLANGFECIIIRSTLDERIYSNVDFDRILLHFAQIVYVFIAIKYHQVEP